MAILFSELTNPGPIITQAGESSDYLTALPDWGRKTRPTYTYQDVCTIWENVPCDWQATLMKHHILKRNKWLIFGEVSWGLRGAAGGQEKSEISFCCFYNNRKSILYQCHLTALQLVWHSDPTNWSYQHLHLPIITFYSNETVSLSKDFPRYASQTKIKQYMSYTDHLLLISSLYVLNCAIAISWNEEAMSITLHSIDHFNQTHLEYFHFPDTILGSKIQQLIRNHFFPERV